MNSEKESSLPRFPAGLLGFALVVTAACTVWLAWNVYDSNRLVVELQHRHLRSAQLQGVITYLDEVLTMSARMAAATGDLDWEKRYRRYEPELDAAIKEATQLAPQPLLVHMAAQTDAANLKLVDMENRAFALVREGRLEQARTVLFSPAYAEQKQIYAGGIAHLTKELNRQFDARMQSRAIGVWFSILSASVVVIVLLIAWYTALRTLTRWRAAFERAHDRLELRVLERTAELQKASLEAHATASRLRAITDSAQDAILLMDPEGRVSHWNPAAERMLGYSSAEAIGKNLHDLIAPARFRQAHQAAFPAFRQTGQGAFVGQTVDLEARRKDGEEISVQVSLSAVQMDGGWHAEGIIRDTTERKRLEKNKEQMLLRQQGVSQLQQMLLAPASLEESLRNVTEAIVHLFDADFCRIWLIRPGDRCEQNCPHAEVREGPQVCGNRDRCLHLLASSGRYTHVDGRGHRRVPFGWYKIGRLASGEVHKFVTNDAQNDPLIHDQTWVRALGLVSFAGYQLRVPGGETLGVLALFAKHPVLAEEDAILDGLSSTVALVVQRAAAEAALRRSETKFRTLYDSSGDAVMLLDAKGFIDCNRAALAMFGCATREEFCSKHPADVSPPVQPDGTDSLTLANQRIATAMEKGGNHFEWLHQRADTGEPFPADVMLTAMQLDGQPVVQALVRNIAERKRTEDTLRQLSRAVEQSPASIVITDPAGNIEYVNPKFVEITGYAQSEALGQNPRILKSGDKSPEAYRELWRTITSGKIWRGEFLNKKKNGELYWESASISPIRDRAGLTTHYVAVKEDITARKQTEAERNQLIQNLQDALAHVKTLSGLLPICASCKKIRDDKGYWSQVESYVQKHSEATFTHGMCPDCIEKFFPGVSNRAPKPKEDART